MNKEIKDKWVTALKSGSFKQGTKVLKTADDCYCCLGVLCELVFPDKFEKHEVSDPNNNHTSAFYFNHAFSMAAGFRINNMQEVTSEECKTLARMNDNWETFETIATYIEENL